MITSLILGSLLGVLIGLLPGMGMFSGLVMVYPYIASLDVSNLLIFYISAAAASQYVGSVSAIVLQVPGEANSIFALKESKILAKEDRTAEALGAATVGSVFGGVGAIIITFTVLCFLEPFVPYFFRSDVKTTILLLSIASFMLFTENKLWTNLVLACIGILLSLVGMSPLGEERTFGIAQLLSGIPWFPLSLGVMILPTIWTSNFKTKTNPTTTKFVWHTGVMFRSTIAGYIGGLVPGISYLMGSKLAWLVENKLSNDPLKRLLAAETANNAGAYSMVIPLLLLGIPIINSEAIILELAHNKQFLFNWKSIVETGWYSSTILPIITVNLCMGVLSFFFVGWLSLWRKIPFLQAVLTIVMITTMCLVSNNLILDFVVFVLSLFVGYIIRNHDASPLMITFLLGDQLEQNVVRLLFMHNLM